MTDENVKRLVEYLKKSIDAGISENVIVTGLLGKGWSKDLVDKAIEELNSQSDQKITYFAQDLMDDKVYSAKDSSKVGEVIDLMVEESTPYVVILKKNKPCGIITKSEILDNLEQGKIDLTVIAADIMTKNLITCDVKDKFYNIVTKMHVHDIEQVPVIKKKKLVGIITAHNIIDFLSVG